MHVRAAMTRNHCTGQSHPQIISVQGSRTLKNINTGQSHPQEHQYRAVAPSMTTVQGSRTLKKTRGWAVAPTTHSEQHTPTLQLVMPIWVPDTQGKPTGLCRTKHTSHTHTRIHVHTLAATHTLIQAGDAHSPPPTNSNWPLLQARRGMPLPTRTSIQTHTEQTPGSQPCCCCQASNRSLTYTHAHSAEHPCQHAQGCVMRPSLVYNHGQLQTTLQE